MRRRAARPARPLSPALVLVPVLACAAAGGCVPIISHDPVVEPGPGSHTALRVGRAAATAGGVAYSIGVQAPGGVVNPVEIEKDYITPGVHWVPTLSYRVAP